MCFQENGRRQKSKVCETFDHLFSLLEEKKGEMTLRINAEQEEKLDYIRGLRKKYSEHMDSTAKLLETAIQTMDESEMALFLQVTKNATFSSHVHLSSNVSSFIPIKAFFLHVISKVEEKFLVSSQS